MAQFGSVWNASLAFKTQSLVPKWLDIEAFNSSKRDHWLLVDLDVQGNVALTGSPNEVSQALEQKQSALQAGETRFIGFHSHFHGIWSLLVHTFVTVLDCPRNSHIMGQAGRTTSRSPPLLAQLNAPLLLKRLNKKPSNPTRHRITTIATLRPAHLFSVSILSSVPIESAGSLKW